MGADDVLVNPEWVHVAGRSTRWSRSALEAVFAVEGGLGLCQSEFAARLREVAAGHFQGQLRGRHFAAQINLAVEGIYDAAALFLPSDSSFTAGAARDLDHIAAWPREQLQHTALAPILGIEPNHEQRSLTAIHPGTLNGEQISAVRNACHVPLSLVTGPPGTGKSQTIVSMVASVLAADGSVLVASKNHQALAAVEDRLGRLAPGVCFLERTIDLEKEIDRSFQDALGSLIDQPARFVRSFDPLLRQRLMRLSRQRDQALVEEQANSALHCDIAELIERIEARQRFSDEDPAFAEPGEPTLSRWRRLLRFLFPSSRRGKALSSERSAPEAGASVAVLKRRLKELNERLATLPVPDDLLVLTGEIAELTQQVLPGILAVRSAVSEDRRQHLIEAKDGFELLRTNSPLPGHLARSVVAHRPLWLASVLGTPKRIPLEPGLFDLVIFDEASQCDIASALPLLARAKRAVVVGDNNQLSFIRQLGLAADRNLMQAQGLAIERMGRFAQSRRSLFDMVARVPHIPQVLLRDQYRSTSEIVEYISDQFYSGQLRAAYDPAAIKATRSIKPGITWTHVAGPSALQGNCNSSEIEAIVAHLEDLLLRERYDGSVGVVTPFRPQANALSEAIHSRLPGDVLKAADMRIGTVDSFQGQERDLIVFSPCVTARSDQSAVTFLQKDWRRLNVAISRARAIAHVFGDLAFAQSGKVTALAKLAAIATGTRASKAEGVFDSDWERRVYHALKARKLQPHPQHEIAGRRLDFALFGAGGVKLDLEIDGRRWHTDVDGKRKLSDRWRDHQLKSLGWRVRRFWVDELSKDMEACLDLIEQDLS